MSFWRSYAHLVWATKNRAPLIGADVEPHLYACLVAKAAELGCFVHAVNGVSDHVHLIISIPPKHSVAWVVKNLKGSSSHLINHDLPAGPQRFAWQRGYGYLSLGEGQCARAVAYVENQKRHHADLTTNSWLERTGDDEDDDEVGAPTGAVAGVREPDVVYDADDEFPF